MKIRFKLNGEERNITVDPGMNLLRLLKESGINSVRRSDDREGFTGSDTILFDGRAMLADLMVAAQADGHSIETVESFNTPGRLSLLQEALLDAGAVQSAFNLPATILVLEELLRRTAEPTEDQVADALSGIFNRATGYKQFFLAVKIAKERLRDPQYVPAKAKEFRDDLRVVGKNAHRIDGVKLASGMKAFVEDRVEPGACVLRMLRSPHAHAYIRKIDISAAETLPGVALIITHLNCPDAYYCQAGQNFPEPTPYDRRMFSQKVRHVGDRVAAVVATDEQTAEEAIGLIKVEYEILEPVLGLDAAAAPGAPAVHGGPAMYASGETAAGTTADPDPREGRVIYQFDIGADPAANIAASASDGVGDLETGFAEADVVIERQYQTSRVQCTPLEPHVVYTKMDGDRLVIHASTQVPWHMRRIVATVLGIKENRIRVIKERIGGGYGSKQDILLEEVCAFATWKTGKPVFYKYSREEELIAATTRHPFRITVKLGAKKDGTLTAMHYKAEADTGAYGNHCLTVPMNSASKALPLFMCDNIGFDLRAYYTNLPPSGAYQGYGAPQGSYAVQTASAELAEELGMDLLDFIEKNRVREGDRLEILKCLGEGKAGSAVTVKSCGLDQALERGRALIGWGRPQGEPAENGTPATAPEPPPERPRELPPELRVGKAGVIIQQGSGLPGLDQSCVEIKMLGDGSFVVYSGGADLGTGLDTVLAKVAAEVLCSPLDQVAVISGDTDSTPFDTGAYASSGTFFTGNATFRAAGELKKKMLDAAATILNTGVENLELRFPGEVAGPSAGVSFLDIARITQSGEGVGQLIGYASYATDDTSFPYAAHFCEVAVNTRTGAIDVRRYYAIHDCGTPVNPELALGQIYGGVLKSIGHTLYEEMIFDDKGRLLNTDLADYGAPTAQELPGLIEAEFVQTDDPYGPFGGKSVAEISMNGAAPAITIAVHDAIGVWIRDWPITPEKILKSLGRI